MAQTSGYLYQYNKLHFIWCQAPLSTETPNCGQVVSKGAWHQAGISLKLPKIKKSKKTGQSTKKQRSSSGTLQKKLSLT